MKKESRSRRGFTVIELLIVLAMLAVLLAVIVAVAIPYVIERVEQTQRSECSDSLTSCRRVLQYELLADDNKVSVERYRALMRESMFAKDGDSNSVKGLCQSGGYYIYDEDKHTIRCSKHEMTQAEVITSNADYIRMMAKTEEFRQYFSSNPEKETIDSGEESVGVPMKASLKKKLRYVLSKTGDFDFRICRVSGKPSSFDGTYTVVVSAPIARLDDGSVIEVTGFKMTITEGLITVSKAGVPAPVSVLDKNETYLYLNSEEYDWAAVEEPVLP